MAPASRRHYTAVDKRAESCSWKVLFGRYFDRHLQSLLSTIRIGFVYQGDTSPAHLLVDKPPRIQMVICITGAACFSWVVFSVGTRYVLPGHMITLRSQRHRSIFQSAENQCSSNSLNTQFVITKYMARLKHYFDFPFVSCEVFNILGRVTVFYTPRD